MSSRRGGGLAVETTGEASSRTAHSGRQTIVATAARLKSAFLPAVAGLLLAGPLIAWALIDRSIWAWDQSLYGFATLNLWATLRSDPDSWWTVMTHVLTGQPPAIAWIGQFFVPLRRIVGSDEAAMLLSSELILALAFALVYVASFRLSDGRQLVAFAGLLAAASAPLLVNVSHWYLVEPVQTLAVVWVLFAMVSARSWHLSLTVAQLGAAISFGLLTKLSTPAYVAAPATVALVLSAIATRETRCPRWWIKPSFVLSTFAMVVLAFFTVCWYRLNFLSAWDHAQLSATSTFWGTHAPFGTHLAYWLRQLQSAFFVPYFDLGAAALLIACGVILIIRRRRPARPSTYLLLVLAGCVGVPVAALALLANQINTDPRFIVPALPAVALALVTLLRIVDIAPVTALACILFGTQFGLMVWQSFDANASTELTRNSYRAVPTSKSALATQIERLVAVSCKATPRGTYNTVGASYAWLNQNTLMMLAAEREGSRSRDCPWASVGSPTSPGAGWRELSARQSPFLLTVDYGNPGNQLPAPYRSQVGLTTAQDKQLNGGNAALLRAALKSGRYSVVPGMRRLGLVLLRHRAG